MKTRPGQRFFVPLLLALGGLLLVLLYHPGLNGPWLVDDDANLGIFRAYATATAPYADIITGNRSGPLGRSVAMASFAANHALGLFDAWHLKATSLAIHLLNGLLLYGLCLALFRIRSPLPGLAPAALALMLTLWWLLLPMHLSAVLYIVQRMTLLASSFMLASCLCYALGRHRLTRSPLQGRLLLAASLLFFFPLALFTKESAFVALPWLVLIELFFFRLALAKRRATGRLLALLMLVTAGLLVVASQLPVVKGGYLSRDFTLQQRLLTEGRVLWDYIYCIFLPDGARMGLFHDDFTVSTGLLQPVTTLLALLGLGGLLLAALRLADGRGWAIAFGLLFFFSGHLVESSVVPLELYFEHRNYLPSLGLLLAAAAALRLLWPGRNSLLPLLLAGYLGLLAFALHQRSHIWASKSLLLENSALNHPHSLRAWTDYPEDLLENRKPRLALEAALRNARVNPGTASISYLQMMSIYCRIREPVPAPLVELTRQSLMAARQLPGDLTTPLGIGLDVILTEFHQGHCPHTDLSSLAPAFMQVEARLRAQYGEQRRSLWQLRLTLAEWLLALQQPAAALAILLDVWDLGRHDQPTAGLVLARALVDTGQMDQARQVLAELAAVTHDAPADFQADMTALQQRATGSR